MNAFMQWMETHFMPMAAKIGSQRHLIMGRDPVELAKRAKYKPPAMRRRSDQETGLRRRIFIAIFTALFSCLFH